MNHGHQVYYKILYYDKNFKDVEMLFAGIRDISLDKLCRSSEENFGINPLII